MGTGPSADRGKVRQIPQDGRAVRRGDWGGVVSFSGCGGMGETTPRCPAVFYADSPIGCVVFGGFGGIVSGGGRPTNPGASPASTPLSKADRGGGLLLPPPFPELPSTKVGTEA